MTQEEKQLLLIDLCARLPYGVICHYDCVIPVGKRSLDKANAKDKLKGIIPMPGGHIGFMVGIDRVDALESDIKPYLRPMSSMTEVEKKEYKSLFTEREEEYNQGCNFFYSYTLSIYDHQNIGEVVDWLNAHYFDYRGLIPMGLALEAPKDMYKTE